MVGVVEVGIVDAEWYRCGCLHCTQGLAGSGDGHQCQGHSSSSLLA